MEEYAKTFSSFAKRRHTTNDVSDKHNPFKQSNKKDFGNQQGGKDENSQLKFDLFRAIGNM